MSGMQTEAWVDVRVKAPRQPADTVDRRKVHEGQGRMSIPLRHPEGKEGSAWEAAGLWEQLHPCGRCYSCLCPSIASLSSPNRCCDASQVF